MQKHIGSIAALGMGTLLTTLGMNLATAGDASTPTIKPTAAGYTLEVFYMDAPEDGIAATNSGDKPIPPYPAGIGVFAEDRISQGFVLLTKLRDANGTVVGFTSEQEVVAPESDVLAGKLLTTTTWTLTLPGRGTIFLAEDENQSEFARKAAGPALMQGREWNEPWTFVTTAGPDPRQRGVIVGGTGEFTGIEGTFVEVTHLRRFTPNKEFFGTIDLELEYRLAPGAQVADSD